MALSRVGGWQTSEAADGPAALAIAKQAQPDLIVLDVMLPGMDGLQTLGALRNDEATAQIPVIFMTARVQSHERTQYAKLGALGVIAKPFDAMKLPEQLAAIWRKHHDAPRCDAEAATVAGRLASVLPRRLAELTSAADEALGGSASPELRDRAIGLAHRLAGSAGTFGAPALGALAGELEHALRDGDDPSARRTLAHLASSPLR